MHEEIDIQGLADVRAALRRLGLATARSRAVRAFIGEEMLRRTEERFARQVGPDGLPWKRSRRTERAGGETLTETGALRSRIAYDATTGEDLSLFSWDKRARVHQLGLTIEPTPGHSFLSIPLRARGGVGADNPRKPVAPRKGRSGRRTSDYSSSSTFIAKIRGRLFIMQHVGEHAVRALFLLVRSVTMPARPFLGFSADDVAMALATFARSYERAFSGETPSA